MFIFNGLDGQNGEINYFDIKEDFESNGIHQINKVNTLNIPKGVVINF